MSFLFTTPRQQALDANGSPLPGAKLRFFDAGTSNPRTVFTDAARTVPHAIPVVADSAGRFAPIFLPDGSYKAILTDQADVTVWTDDNLDGPVDLATLSIDFAKPRIPTISKTAAATLTTADLGQQIVADTSGGSFQLTLPAVSGADGKPAIIRKHVANGTVSLKALGSDLIYSAGGSFSSYQIAKAGATVMLMPAGGGWYVWEQLPNTSGSITPDMLSSSLSGSFVQVGSLLLWPKGSNYPAGYLAAEGQAVSRTTYATLFALVGTIYGPGDGSTTFNLPDYRGYFLRGHDNGAGRDPDASTRTDSGGGTVGDNVGTVQADDFKSHAHATTVSTVLNLVAKTLGSFVNMTTGGFGYGTGPTAWGLSLDPPTVFTTATATNTVTNLSMGGAETRPLNRSVKVLIFADPSAASGGTGSYSTFLHGFGAPADSLGNNSDLYLDLTAGKFWGPKASNSWSGLSFRATLHAGLNYIFSTTITDADPGAGVLRLNNASLGSATAAYVAATDDDGNSVGSLIAAWANSGNTALRGRMVIKKLLSGLTYAQYDVTGSPGLHPSGAHYDVTLSNAVVIGTLADLDPISVQFVPAGPAGPTGTGTPGGATTQVQFNDAGSLAGDAGLVYNKTTKAMTGTGAWTAASMSSTTTVTATTDLIGKRVTPQAGTTTSAPVVLSTGVNLTTPVAGSVEYDGTVEYFTNTTGRGVVPVEHFLQLIADQTGTNVATAQPLFPGGGVTGIAVQANTTYEFEIKAEIDQGAAGLHSLGFLFAGTATLTAIDYLAITGNSNGSAVPTGAAITRATVATVVNITAAVAAVTQNQVWIRGTVRINAAGTLIPQFQYSAAPGAAPTIKAGTKMRVWAHGTSSVLNVGPWS